MTFNVYLCDINRRLPVVTNNQELILIWQNTITLIVLALPIFTESVSFAHNSSVDSTTEFYIYVQHCILVKRDNSRSIGKTTEVDQNMTICIIVAKEMKVSAAMAFFQ